MAALSNLAVRSTLDAAGGALTVGFVIDGNAPRRLLVRAIGPGLAQFGVAGVVSDPRLIVRRETTVVAENDNWTTADAAVMARVGAFAFPGGSRDAALVASLRSGDHSAPVLAADSGSGVALVEVYDTAPGTGPAIVNASTRAFVGTGDNVLIPGFVVGGTGTMRLLIRAVGPALAGFGVAGALADPTITLYRDGRALWTNDNWSSSDQATEIANTSSAVGAFPLTAGSRKAL